MKAPRPQARHRLNVVAPLPSSSLPSADGAATRTALLTHDSLAESTLIAQTLFDAGALNEGQRVVVESYRSTTVHIVDGRVTLVPSQETA